MTTYVIGHKHPDTDSIASAMAYTDLKQQLGYNVEAGRLGPLNEETKFATRYFQIEAPKLLQDARCMIKDIQIDPPCEIRRDDSCNTAYRKIVETAIKTLYVTDEKHHLEGIVSTSDLASLRLQNDAYRENLLAQSNLSVVAEDVKGDLLCEKEYVTNGRVMIYGINAEKENHQDAIVVLEDKRLLEDAILEKPALIIYCGERIREDMISFADIKGVSLIRTDMNMENVLRIIYEAVPVSLLMSENIVCYSEDEYIEDITSKIMRTRYRAYPIVDHNGVIKGSISRYHLFNYEKKKFILVDHSSRIQSIANIDSAEVTEIIDHHHIGDIETKKPIYYRNEKCGCTCTLIYSIFMENGLKPDPKIAGMMLSAIISDTLFFKSETTTNKDVRAAKELAMIAEVEIEEYAHELLAASVNLKDADILELFKTDMKQYTFEKSKVVVGQTNYDSIEDIQVRIEDFRRELKKYQEETSCDLLIMMFTHVLAQGSMFLFYGPRSEVMHEVLETLFDEHSGYDHRIMSRKQQLIPVLSEIMNQY